jgi:hypothetical protein
VALGHSEALGHEVDAEHPFDTEVGGHSHSHLPDRAQAQHRQ